MDVDLAAVRRRLAAIAAQWRPPPASRGTVLPPASRGTVLPPSPLGDAPSLGSDADDPAGPQVAPAARSVRAIVTVLLLLGLVAGWWWWQGRPREVLQRSDVTTMGAPVTGLDPASAVSPGPPVPGDAVGDPVAATPVVDGPPSPPPGTVPQSTVIVHVAGPVRHPGVVRLPAGSRVVDAIDAAGGLRRGSRLGAVNLARPVVDGERIDVGAAASPPMPQGATAGAPGSATVPGTPGSPAAPLDLNTATQATLEELPGVGPVLAGRILAWRAEHGRFSSVAELQEVSGIGDATYAELAPLVRVTSP